MDQQVEKMVKKMTPQELIEEKIYQIVALGNYEAAYLFSTEGLPMAHAASSGEVDPDRLAEMSIMFQDVQRLAATMGGIKRLHEVYIEGSNHRKVIFRTLIAFGENVVLAAVVAPGKTYRKHTNDLQKLIQAIEF